MPPQGFAEQAFFDGHTPLDRAVAGELPPTRDGKPVITGPTADKQLPLLPTGPEALALPARVRMAGPSRLAFRMPDQVEALSFTLLAVLGTMGDWPAHLDVGARGDQLFDPLWPQAEVAGRLNEAIVGRFGKREGAAVGRGLNEAAARVADVAAGGLGGGAAAPVAWQALQTEAAELFERHPKLREGSCTPRRWRPGWPTPRAATGRRAFDFCGRRILVARRATCRSR